MNFIPWEEYQKTIPQKRMSAGILIFDKSGRLLLLKPSYKDHWVIPGGVVEKDESPLEAARREIKEETGLEIDAGNLLAVNYNRAVKNSEENIQWWFYGGIISEGQKRNIKVDGEEITDFKFVTLEEAGRLGNRNYIKYKTIIGRAKKTGRAVYMEDWEEMGGI